MNLRENLYRKLYLIRAAEEAIKKYYHENEMKSPMHMSTGSEAISAGVCQALNKNDQVICSYRSHACYLAKTEDTDEFFLELYGKADGVSHGKAGSMHLSKVEFGHIMSSAIVASHLSIGAGVAFANKKLENNKICAVFFGDGALEEGAFWETLNLACLMKLPLLMVCEDNGLAVHTAKEQRKGYRDIDEIVSKFNCVAVSLPVTISTDTEAVFGATQNAIESIRYDKRPVFLRIPYYRYLEHVGINEDFHRGYRSKDEFEQWEKRDPVLLMRAKLSEPTAIEKEIDDRISKSVEKANQAVFADVSELYEDVFSE